MNTIIVGLGNPILGDDGVGWRVVEEVQRQLTSPSPALSGATAAKRGAASWRQGKEDITFEFLSLGGISLMEHLIGYERAILIDAVTTDQAIGSVVASPLSEMPAYSAFHISSPHDTSLQNALKLGKFMGAKLPKEVTVVGIATDHIYDFSESLSPLVAEAIPRAVKIVMDLLQIIIVH
jgi:hydrogenase maturation protease